MPSTAKLKEAFQSLGQDAFTLSHYELAEHTAIGKPHEWKEFLLNPEINDWIKSELKLIHNAELNKLLKGISNSNSTGQAQIIGALSKLQEEDAGKKEGPAMIYCYIPLNEQQKNADNVIFLEDDPFIVEE